MKSTGVSEGSVWAGENPNQNPGSLNQYGNLTLFVILVLLYLLFLLAWFHPLLFFFVVMFAVALTALGKWVGSPEFQERTPCDPDRPEIGINPEEFTPAALQKWRTEQEKKGCPISGTSKNSKPVVDAERLFKKSGIGRSQTSENRRQF